MNIISDQELNYLKDKKAWEITLKDAETLVEHKDIFLKFVQSEIREYQYALWSGKFSWNWKEAEDAIKCLMNLWTRLSKIDEVMRNYYKEQEAKKAQ